MRKTVSLGVALAGCAMAAASAASAMRDFGDVLPKLRSKDMPPQRLSIELDSPHYDRCVKRVEVNFNGARRQSDVVEYDEQEGWIRIHQLDGNNKVIRDASGKAVTRTLYGVVAPYFRVPEFRAPPSVTSVPNDAEHLRKAEEKRARKAAKLAGMAS